MNSYLTNLIGRTQGNLPVLQPRPVSIYESAYAAERPVEATTAVSTTLTPPTKVTHQTATIEPVADISLSHPKPAAPTQPNQTEIAQRLSYDSGPVSVQLPNVSPHVKAASQPVHASMEPAPLQPESPIPAVSSKTSASLAAETNSEPSLTETYGYTFIKQSRTGPLLSVTPAAPNHANNNIDSQARQTAVLMPTTTPYVPVIEPTVEVQHFVKEPSLLLAAASPPWLAVPIAFNKEWKALKSEQQLGNVRSVYTHDQSSLVPVLEPNISRQHPAAPKASTIGHIDAMPIQTITVKIGRVEVRAAPPAEPSNSSYKQRTSNTLSLEDYLNRRQGGTS